MMPVLLTRPDAASRALAGTLEAWGAEVTVSPLLAIRYAAALPALSDGLVFTSANGVAAYRALGGSGVRAVWCVGPTTAAAAADIGLTVRGVARDVETLAEVIPGDAPPLTHLRGAVQRGDLVAALGARGITAQDAVIYHQDAVPLSPDALELLRAPTLVPLYSPRTAALFVAACPPEAFGWIRVVALSTAVAEVLPIAATIADVPEGEAMLDAIKVVLCASTVEGAAGSD